MPTIELIRDIFITYIFDADEEYSIVAIEKPQL